VCGLETLHSLVAVVDLPKATRFPARVVLNFGVYALYLKQTNAGDYAMENRFTIIRKEQ
jgi:hypothetical protein